MFVITTPAGVVAGFTRSHGGMVQVTNDKAYMKVFKTREAANKFIEKYADAGYGLGSKTAFIVTAP